MGIFCPNLSYLGKLFPKKICVENGFGEKTLLNIWYCR